MKKRLLPILVIICALTLVAVGLVACSPDGDSSPAGGKKLDAPVVTLNGNIASWTPDTNATGYEISMGGSVLKVASSITRRTLAEGITFKVRAVGDGSKYLTSDWSNAVTYQAIQDGEATYNLNFLMINDTHGAFTDSGEGYSIGRVDTLKQQLESTNGDYIFIQNGDAFQGSYICGETYGLAMVEALNAMELDCFVLGNHEFDWGLDKIEAYADGNTANGEADFPFLGANILYRENNTRPDWIDAYTIVEQNGVKVGIIGLMGYAQESSILNRYVKDYYFANPLTYVKSNAEYLRNTAGCDVVVVATHDYDETFVVQVSNLKGSKAIDAIFCAHTHRNIGYMSMRADLKEIPVVQCYHKNNNIAEVNLTLNSNKDYVYGQIDKYWGSDYAISSRIQTIINEYQDLINESNRVLGTADGGYSSAELGYIATNLMQTYDYSSYDFSGVDVSVINTGGVRAEIDSGNILVSEVFEVFPFNNAVVLVNIRGAILKDFCASNAGYFYITGDYSSLSDSATYQLAVIDYVFENSRYDEYLGNISDDEYIQTDIVLRDLLLDYFDEGSGSGSGTTATTLSTPVVSVNSSGVASWSAIQNASSYKYKINGGSEQTTTALSLTLSDGDTLVVKAVGDGVNYLDSAYSTLVTYTAPVEGLDTTPTINEFNQNFEAYIDEATVVTIEGVAYSCDNSGIFIKDSSGENLYVKTSYSDLNMGQTITVTGSANKYYTMPQLMATNISYGSVGSYSVDIVEVTIAQLISDNTAQSELVFDHKVYNVSGTVTQSGSYYNLVDGSYTIQFKSSTYTADLNTVALYSGKEISINVVLGDLFTTTSTFRVLPLRGNMDIVELGTGSEEDDGEPAMVETTISDLVQTPPTEEKTVIYKVTGTWTLDTSKTSASTYGNGFLSDEHGNQITVYGLCASDSVLTWDGSAYTFSNDRSYSSLGISDGYTIMVGMVYSVQYSNYMCYLIEVVDDGSTEDTTTNNVNFLMINDTHGAFTDSAEGYSIGRVDTLKQQLESTNDYIFIQNGDAFQGSYVCGETYGLAMVEALNAMELDCFVLGNHEFDWGLDKIEAYADGNTANGEADFPFLGANILYASNNTRPDWIDAYTIVEQNGVKVGIIGVIGYGQESSILNRYVKDYYFANPISYISDNASYLRNTAGCDVVVVAMHDYDEGTIGQIATLNGSSEIDAIFCAHTHQNIGYLEERADGLSIPVVQCYHKNNNVAEVRLTLDENNDYSSGYYAKHAISTQYGPAISTRVQAVINEYQDIIDEGNTVIGTTSSALSKATLGGYATATMLSDEYAGYGFGAVDVSIINTGGVRATIDNGDITRAEVFEVFPFNNAVVLVNISGALIKSLYSDNSGFLYIDVVDTIGDYTDLNDTTIYQLAVIDFVFEGTYYDEFDSLTSDDYVQTDIIMRDLLMEYIDNAF